MRTGKRTPQSDNKIQHKQAHRSKRSSRRIKPTASRPHMPREYGILEPTKGMGLLPWNWGTERLSNSRSYWIATTRPDGRPHVMIVWGIWLDDKFYFSTSPRSRKARNLALSPNSVVCTERADEAVIMEGVVERVSDSGLRRRFEGAYRRKYQEAIDTSQSEVYAVYAVRPEVAFGFVSDPDRWAGSVTRWKFDGD